MRDFIEKLIGRLEKYKYSHLVEHEKRRLEHCMEDERAEHCEGIDCFWCVWNKAIEIVNQLAEEYNNGWISVEDALPELTEGTECFKQSPCCLVTLKWWDGDMTESVGWYNQSGVWSDDSKNCKVVAWMPLPPKYQPKGE